MRYYMRKFNALKLKTILEEQNITQANLAEKLDLHPSTVSAWINNKAMPDFENLNKICEILNISPSELLDESIINNLTNNPSSANNINMYNSNVTINYSGGIVPELSFSDGKNDNTVLISHYIDKDIIPKVMEGATKNNTSAGIYLNELIKKTLQQ